MTVTAIKLADLIGRGRGPDGEAVAFLTADSLKRRSRAAAAAAPTPKAPVAASPGTSRESPAPAPATRDSAASEATAGNAAVEDETAPAEAAPAGPTDPVVKDIEMLAVKLYAISRRKRSDPAEAMREALRSIEACLSAIKKQH